VSDKTLPTGVIVVTDKKSYPVGTTVVGTVISNTTASVFLQGCSIFSWEKQVGGSWVDKGPTMLCAWEGYAKEVKPGESLPEDGSPHGPGTWRLAALYGVGCTPGKPLSEAGCSSKATARSDPFTVGTTLERCIKLQSEYATALIGARKCTTSAPAQCEEKVLDSLACNCFTYVQDDSALQAIHKQYLALGCDKMSGIPVCPPMACPDVVGGGCVKNKCVDFGPD
jgi:hypothetical protein